MARRALRWARRVVLAAVTLALVGGIAAAIALHTDWGRDRVRAQLEAKLWPYFPAGARIGRLEGSVLGDFSLHDIELRDREGRPAVTIARVELNIGLTAWLDDEARLESVIVEGVAIELHQHGGDPPNLATMFEPNADPLTFEVVIERLVVRGAAITIERDGRVDHLDDVGLEAEARVQQDGAVQARAAVAARWRVRRAPVAISGRFELDPDGAIAVPAAKLVVGGVAIEATGVGYGGAAGVAAVRGALQVVAPPGALAALAPAWMLPRLPLDLHVDVAPAANDAVAIRLRGTAGAATLVGAVVARPLAPHPTVVGSVMVHGLDGHEVVAGLPSSAIDAAVVVALALDPSRHRLAALRGTISVSGAGRVDAVRFDRIGATAAFDGGDAAAVIVDARGDGDTWVRAAGTVVVVGDAVVVRDGTLIAHSAALDRVTPGRIAIGGAFDVDLTLDGRLDGAAARVAVRGTIAGRRMRRDDVRVAALDVRLALDDVPTRPGGTATLSMRGVTVADLAVPDVVASARGRLGGGYHVSARAEDPALGVGGSVDAEVTIGDLSSTIADVRLGRYALHAGATRLAGRGGRILITPDRVAVSGVGGQVAGGSLAVDASVSLARPGDVAGEVAITGLDLAQVRGLPGVPALGRGTVDLRAGLDRRRAHLELAVRGAAIGELTVAVDLAPPRRPTELASWTALDRRAVRGLRIDARAVDLNALGDTFAITTPLGGRIDALVQLGAAGGPAAGASAELHGRGLIADGLPAPLDLDVVFDLDQPAVTKVDLTAALRGIGAARVTAAVRVPIHVFDVDAWRRLGLGAVEDARLRIDALTIDDAVAASLGLGTVRGELTVDATASPGLREIEATVVARDLRAGPLVEPIGVSLQLVADASGARATVRAGLGGTTVATAEVSSPLDVIAALRRGLAPTALPVRGAVTLPETELAMLGRALGLAAPPSARIRGGATVEGTLGAPTATVDLVLEHLGARRGRRGGQPRGGLRTLTVGGAYAAGQVHVEVRGQQDDGGALAIDADVELARSSAARASIVATGLQLRPLARLAPDALFGVSGVLDADLRLRGLEPATASVLGQVRLTKGTLPIHDVVGVLRDTAVTLDFDPGRVHAAISGAIETGRLEVVADAALDGLLPQRGTIDATVRGLELITSSAPRVDGTLHAEIGPTMASGPGSGRVSWWGRAGDHVTIDAALRGATVTARASKGRDLHPSGLPLDLVFADTRPGAPVAVPRAVAVRSFVGAAPDQPLAEIALRIEPVTVVTPILRGEVSGQLAGAIGLDGATVEGRLEVARGDVVLLERRYRLRRAVVTFDGSIDPLLDVQLERDLPELTLLANVSGRASDPRLTLSSDPATYTEGQLLAFALADSASAPGSETSDAATNLLAAVASQAIVGAIAPLLPVRIDVIAYEPASATSGRAFVFGRWITRKLLVLYRNRAEARPDQNVNEAEAEYWLDQRVLVEGVAGDRGVLGLDLLWTRRW